MKSLASVGAESTKEERAERKSDRVRHRRARLIVKRSIETPEPDYENSNLSSGQLEYMFLVNVLVNEELRSRVWPRVTADHFFSDAAHALYSRVNALIRAGRGVPSLAVLAADPALPESSKTLINATLARVDAGKPITRKKFRVDGKSVSAEDSDDYENVVFRVLDDYRVSRKAVELMANGVERLAKTKDPTSSPAFIDELGARILSLRSGIREPDTMLVVGHEATDDDKLRRKQRIRKLYSTKARRWKTGITAYDDISGGLYPGEVTVVGSTPGGGKSALMFTMMLNMMRMGTSTAMLQLELNDQQVDQRITSNIAEIDSNMIRSGRIADDPKLQKKIDSAWEELQEIGETKKSRFVVHAPPSQTLEGCELMFKKYPYRVWFIDYLNLMRYDGSREDWLKLSDLTKAFKELAKKYQIAIVLAAQVGVDKETGEIEVRYSKAIKDHADVFLAWYLSDADRQAGTTWIKHLKARQYEPKDFQVAVELQFSRFGNFAEATAQAQESSLGSKTITGGKVSSGGQGPSAAPKAFKGQSRKEDFRKGKAKKVPQEELADEMARNAEKRVKRSLNDLVQQQKTNRANFDDRYADEEA